MNLSMLFVLPSKVKEAFGLVLCEAMYCHIPMITTDSGAQREIEHNVSGIIVPELTVPLLSKAIEDIYRILIKENNFSKGYEVVNRNLPLLQLLIDCFLLLGMYNHNKSYWYY